VVYFDCTGFFSLILFAIFTLTSTLIMKKLLPLFVFFAVIFASCGTVQSFIKSSFPYTTTLTIPAANKSGTEYTAVNTATSFDQDFTKDGDNGYKINKVRITGARLKSTEPSDYNIGNLEWVKIYVSKPKGGEEIKIASRTDIGESVGNMLTLDINNDALLDELVRQPNIRVRMEYKVRKSITTDATLHLMLNLNAHAAN